MRARCGVLGVVIAIAACGSSPAAESTTSATRSQSVPAIPSASIPCGPSGARTLASDALARVYEAGGTVYGCARGGRRLTLGNSQNCIRSALVQPVAIAGETAAFGSERCGIDTGSSEVIVLRLSDGRQLRSLAAINNRLPPESYVRVGSVVVRADGSVAWIGTGSSIIRHSRDVEVQRADKRGQTELDSGTAVYAASMRLRGSTLTWRHAGATRSATLL